MTEKHRNTPLPKVTIMKRKTIMIFFIYHKNQQYGYDELIGYLHMNTNTNQR
jgi:hypothetical protein